jgi:hypothetical protein
LIINKPDGNSYDSDGARNEGISFFNEDIYRKSPEELPDLSNCIENFLGDKVLINPLVTNSELIE